MRPQSLAHDACHTPGAPHSLLSASFSVLEPMALLQHSRLQKSNKKRPTRYCWLRKSVARQSPEEVSTRRVLHHSPLSLSARKQKGLPQEVQNTTKHPKTLTHDACHTPGSLHTSFFGTTKLLQEAPVAPENACAVRACFDLPVILFMFLWCLAFLLPSHSYPFTLTTWCPWSRVMDNALYVRVLACSRACNCIWFASA